MANVLGTNNSELLNAADGVTNSGDAIYGLGGNDTIYGLGGNDSIFGGNDHDIIRGGAGADLIYGDAGTDTAVYDDSNVGVTVSLISGNGTGGTAEGDHLVGIEYLVGSAHQDLLVGDDNFNILEGRNGADNLKGSGGDDYLDGSSGNDMLKGGGGQDTLNGGADIDTAAYNQSDEGVVVSIIYNLAQGGHAQGDELNEIENLTGSSYGDHLGGNNAVNVLKGMNGNDELKGYGGEDQLFGGNNNDTLQGLNEDDTLHGENGNDELDGGAGDDTMIGGFGNDTYIVDSVGDVVVEAANAGSDTVKVNFSYTLSDSVNVETLRTSNDAGTTAINLTGNSIVNTLVGNAGANILDGKGGADIMSGHAGNDTYYVNHANDFVNELAGQGGDTVRTTVNYQLDAGKEVEALTTTSNNGVDADQPHRQRHHAIHRRQCRCQHPPGPGRRRPAPGHGRERYAHRWLRERQVPVQHRAERRHQRRHHHRHDGWRRHYPARRCLLRRDRTCGRVERRCLPHRRGRRGR